VPQCASKNFSISTFPSHGESASGQLWPPSLIEMSPSYGQAMLLI
jgi:hypothetical protein